jgi:hypothetical protein
MSNPSITTVATMGVDLGKNSFPMSALIVVVWQNWSRGQIEARLVPYRPAGEALQRPLEIRRRQHGRSARIAGAAPVRERLVGQHTGPCLLMRTGAR